MRRGEKKHITAQQPPFSCVTLVDTTPLGRFPPRKSQIVTSEELLTAALLCPAAYVGYEPLCQLTEGTRVCLPFHYRAHRRVLYIQPHVICAQQPPVLGVFTRTDIRTNYPPYPPTDSTHCTRAALVTHPPHAEALSYFSTVLGLFFGFVVSQTFYFLCEPSLSWAPLCLLRRCFFCLLSVLGASPALAG